VLLCEKRHVIFFAKVVSYDSKITIFRKKVQKYLRMSKKSSTFATDFVIFWHNLYAENVIFWLFLYLKM